MFDGVLNTSLHHSSQKILYAFREVSFAKKKLGESRNLFLQMFGETSPNELLLLPKSLYNNLLHKGN